MYCVRTLEQLQLHVLAMQLLIDFFTALLPDILANNFFIAMTAYRTDEITFGPKLATPQTLFDHWDTAKDLAGCETFDHLDNFGWTIARNRLHKKMDMIFVGANLQKGQLIPLSDVQANVFEHRVNLRVKDDSSILGRTHDVVEQCGNIMSFMTIVTHKSDYTISEKAEASFEESDP
jgi:hypothetical protein